jgi:hypothetical protein
MKQTTIHFLVGIMNINSHFRDEELRQILNNFLKVIKSLSDEAEI